MPSTLQLQLDPKVEFAYAHASYNQPPTIDDAGNVDGDWDERTTNGEGYTAFQKVESGQSFVLIRAKGFEDTVIEVTMPHDDLISVPLVRKSTVPTRLRVQGRHFFNAFGRCDIKGADSFQAYDRFLRGEDLSGVFGQLRDKGFNAIRVFGMDKAIPEQLGWTAFKPQEHANYYSALPEFCRLAGSFGLYVYFVVFADTGDIMPNEGDQKNHFLKVVDALKSVENTFGSLGNELRQHENFVDKTKMPRPSGIAFSSGSEGMDEPTQSPWWDFDEFHPRRDYPNAIKDCNVVDHPNYLFHNLAVLIDEPDRFGSNGNNNVEQCALQAGATVESTLGIVFHSKNGLYSQMLDDLTSRHADAFINALTTRDK